VHLRNIDNSFLFYRLTQLDEVLNFEVVSGLTLHFEKKIKNTYIQIEKSIGHTKGMGIT